MSAPVESDVETTMQLPAVHTASVDTFTWFDERYAVVDMGTPIYDQLLRDTFPDLYAGRHAL